MTTSKVPRGKIARAATYLELPLYDIVHKEAQEKGITVSTWLRSLVLMKLVADGKIGQQDLLKMVS